MIGLLWVLAFFGVPLLICEVLCWWQDRHTDPVHPTERYWRDLSLTVARRDRRPS